DPALVAGEVPAAVEGRLGGFRVLVVAAEHAERALRGDPHGDVALLPGAERLAGLAHDPDVETGGRLAHRPGPHRHAAVVGHQVDGLGLAVAVVDGEAPGALFPDPDDLGVEGLG